MGVYTGIPPRPAPCTLPPHPQYPVLPWDIYSYSAIRHAVRLGPGGVTLVGRGPVGAGRGSPGYYLYVYLYNSNMDIYFIVPKILYTIQGPYWRTPNPRPHRTGEHLLHA